MTRRKASMESILGRKFIRKRTARRYFQRGVEQYYKTHPKETSENLESDTQNSD